MIEYSKQSKTNGKGVKQKHFLVELKFFTVGCIIVGFMLWLIVKMHLFASKNNKQLLE